MEIGANSAPFISEAVAGYAETSGIHLVTIGKITSFERFLIQDIEGRFHRPGYPWTLGLG